MSRNNRKNPTKSEQLLWEKVLKQKKTGFIFLRQKPIGRFILDFYCSSLRLAIEVDGHCHDMKKEYDETRDRFLKAIGITTMRFTNDEVENDIEGVTRKIMALIPPPCQRRG